MLNRIIAHHNTRKGVKYCVRWYGYTFDEDTYKPADGLPRAFIDLYWRNCSRAPQRAPRDAHTYLPRAKISGQRQKRVSNPSGQTSSYRLTRRVQYL